jgi:hypothetical protein
VAPLPRLHLHLRQAGVAAEAEAVAVATCNSPGIWFFTEAAIRSNVGK